MEPKPHWLNKTSMAASLGITVQAFDKWKVEPVARIGRENFYDVRSVLDNRLALAEQKAEAAQGTEGIDPLIEYKLMVERQGLTAAQRIAQEKKNEMADRTLVPVEFCTFALGRLAAQVGSILDTVALNPCGDGIPWSNIYPDLLLGASILCGRRFTQAVTEKYTLSVVAEQSIAQAGEVISRQSLSIDYSTDFSDKWESDAFGIDAKDAVPNELGVATGHIDERSESQRASAFSCLLNQAKTAIVLAHTATTISWDVRS